MGRYGEDDQNCKNCHFWEGKVNYDNGDCRRYPPRLVAGIGGSDYFWAFTNKYDWCGEFKQKEEK